MEAEGDHMTLSARIEAILADTSVRGRYLLAAVSIALSAAYAAHSLHSKLWLYDQPLSLVDLLWLPHAAAHALGIAAFCNRSLTCPDVTTFLATGMLATLPVSALYALGVAAVMRRAWRRESN